MPLLDFETMDPVTEIPFRAKYDLFLSRMTEQEVTAIDEWIEQRIEGDEIHTAGWLPGPDWTGTVLQPIHEKAARRDPVLAGQCFGLMVFVAFMGHREDWLTGRFELNGREIGSRTYFKRRY